VFIEAIRRDRHYLLDHIARIELGGRHGLERIVLAPERWDGEIGYVGFLLTHKRGTFLGTVMLAPPGEQILGWPALVNAPAFDRLDQELEPEEIANALAPLTVLALAAWRNIVVPRVRDEHYDVSVRRKPKGSGARATRRARRADLAVVEYLPRLLAIHRAEEQARRERGEKALRPVYRVGNFVKALPDGQRRSPEAEAFARSIGIPLADWQTIVRAHYRGGTPDEREAAEHADEVPIREWRSWDALDLLT
jgi:hypothetical protein